jgi:AraC-like DNA-binding protein
MISESLDTDFTPLLSHRISKQDFTLPFPLGSGSYILRCRTIKKNGLYSYLSLPVIVDVPSWDPVAGLKGLSKAFIVDPATGKEERLLERDKLYELHIKLNEIKEVFALLWLHHTEYSGGNYENRGGLFNRKFNYVFNFSLGVEPIFYAGTEEIGRRSIRVDGSEYLYIEDSDNFFRVDSTDKTARIRFRLLPEAYPGEWILSGYLEHSREKRSPMFVAKYKVLNAAEASILEKQRDKERKVNIALYAILSAAVTTAIVFGSATYIRRKRDKNRTAQESVKARLIDSSYNVKDENHPQKHLVMRAQKFIHENYQNSISLSDVAQELKCSEVWAAKIFRQAVGMTVVQYITKIRIEKACELLSGTSLRITDIALKIGYSNMVHFGRVFKAEIGVTPKDYRKSRLPIKI